MDFIKETPSNINELVKMAGDKTNWKRRLQAVQQMKKYDCQQIRDVITRLALHDRVYKVKEEAFRVAQGLGIKKQGKPIFLGKKDIGYKSSDFTKIFKRIKRECKMDELDIKAIKDKLIIINPEMYDVMNFEKGKKLDEWIENKYKSLPKDKNK
ncbi:HEAT repeat domain-containing protein [Clostridium botulinum]|uniref:hypothetical protein n=1 Tax=Clostridium botulinum TaxID=1491 RepID=UPI000773C1B1|nr:hypothetical protein [Clostridium botulinum]MCS6110395.1 HEAT repeat domain-containing protein [Clostridium botulinum]NFE13136.1 HEAT repeat domain-containing protein [Clostridium botulinum]NFE83120.1 HEAT repeat domain-containing protein [Clostridium botulinum]NFG39420.1 HEAT repeat domain-containing protein [Clostridium botulinum]NFL42228.1 HEAT repeat domain-containing protein [Clostridium botulinum]